MKTYLLKGVSWLLVSCLLSSCKCGDLGPTKPSSAFIYYRNSKGQDLLDPSTAGYFGQSGLTISYSNPDGTAGNKTLSAFKLPSGSSSSNFPDGYYLTIDPFGINYNGTSGIVRGNSCVILLQLNKSITDTLTFDYSGRTLTSFFYNKTLVSPPTGMTSYPMDFPVMVTK